MYARRCPARGGGEGGWEKGSEAWTVRSIRESSTNRPELMAGSLRESKAESTSDTPVLETISTREARSFPSPRTIA